jgi:hypothetical protein
MIDGWIWNGKLCALTLLCFALPAVLLDLLQEIRKDENAVLKLHPVLRTVIYLICFALIVLCGVRGNHAFIYFQF